MSTSAGVSSTLWDEEADLVVIGSGAAGLTAAVVAAIEGARVILLEKTEFVGGTSSLSGGGLWIPMNHHMHEVGVTDSRAEALGYVRACVGDAADDDVLVSLVDNAAPMLLFLETRAGCEFRPYPSSGPTFDYRTELPGAKHGGRAVTSPRTTWLELGEWQSKVRVGPQSAWVGDKLEYFGRSLHAQPPHQDAARRYMAPGEKVGEFVANGTALVVQLLKACLRHEVDVRLQAPVERLLVDDRGVRGVQARRDGVAHFVRAVGGVIVATGGFSHSDELKRMWMDRPLLGSCEIMENQGDGQLMGVSVGAQLAGLGDASWSPQGGGPRQLPHSIIVNRSGRRFVNEAQSYFDICEAFGTKTGQGGAKNIPAWVVFDRQCVDSYQAAAELVQRTGETQSVEGVASEASGDLDRLRAGELLPVVEARTLDQLASMLGADAEGLARTVELFNAFAQAGKDPEFGRGDSDYDRSWGDPNHRPNPSLGSIEAPPFYATPIYPGALATKGGLLVNGNAEVLSASGRQPIPGLFAAGVCTSGVYPTAYPGLGSTLGAGMTFAYLAARRAIKDLPTVRAKTSTS